MVEGDVRAEQDARLTDALDRLFDLRVHRHARSLEIDVWVSQRDVDRAVDVDDVSVPHVAKDDPRFRKLDGELLDAPWEREERVAAVDKNREGSPEPQADDGVRDPGVRR